MLVSGYKQLKNCAPGDFVRTQSGTYIIISEYKTMKYPQDGLYDSHIAGSGEYFVQRDPEAWVAVIDLGKLDEYMDAEGELSYPSQPNH